MFANSGVRIKRIAKVLCILWLVAMGAYACWGLITAVTNMSYTFSAMVRFSRIFMNALIAGALGWLVFTIMYGFGETVEFAEKGLDEDTIKRMH